jgi:hypothetical protein
MTGEVTEMPIIGVLAIDLGIKIKGVLAHG